MECIQGVLRVGQKIEVRPGITTKDESGGIKCTPIFSRIVSLFAEKNELQFAVPGGLIGVGTTIDPTLTRADRLVGQVLGEVGELPDVFVELEVIPIPQWNPVSFFLNMKLYDHLRRMFEMPRCESLFIQQLLLFRSDMPNIDRLCRSF